jgi:hypothetical protein
MKKFVLIMLIATSCAPVYVPNARNSPMFTKAGEVQGSMQFGNGLDLQGAVSITNHIGLMANYSYADRNTSSFDSDYEDTYHHHKFFEGAIGYYENDGNWCYEVFAGYGQGEGASVDEYSWWGGQTGRATGRFERYFIQPAFGLNKKVMHVSFVPRISIVDFSEFTNDVLTYSVDEDPRVFIEPAVIGRVNLMDNHLFFVFQAGFSFPATSNLYYDYRPFQFSTGMGFRFGGAKKKEETIAPTY